MAPLVKMRELHRDTEKECKDDKEIIDSTDACTQKNIKYKERIFCSWYRKPLNSDFQGIKYLLREIFPNAHLDIDSLTRLIISRYICLVLKQTSSEDDDAYEINDPIDVYSVSTVVRVKQNVNCILQLRDHLMILVNEYAPDSTKAEIINFIEDDAIELELLINERNTRIPAEMAIAPLESLFIKMQRSRCQRCVLNSTYCIYICKIFNTMKKYKKELNQKNILQKEKILWLNLEEKIISKQATFSFEFPVNSELVNGLPNKTWVDGPNYWNPDDYDSVVPYRRVLIFEFSKLQQIIDKMRQKFDFYDSFYRTDNVQV